MGIMDLKLTGNKGVIDNHLPEYRAYNLTVRYNEIRFLEPLITADMRNLASSIGTDFIGTEYSVKTASSVEDKLQRIEQEVGANFDPMKEMLKLKDMIRYTEICPHDEIMSVANQTILDLQDKGYTLSGIRNYYASPYPDTGYQGLHLNFITPYGQEIELQVHSEESFAAKQEAHGLYERIRSVSAQIVDKDLLKNEINEIHSSIKKPSRYEVLPAKWDLEGKEYIINSKRNDVDIDFEESRPNERPYALSYSVTMNDTPLMCGFENMFSDGSARVYRNNIRDNVATYSSIDKTGIEISTKIAAQREMSLEEALNIAAHAEALHVDWMNHNFNEKNLEDISMSLKNDLEQDLEIASQQFSNIEREVP